MELDVSRSQTRDDSEVLTKEFSEIDIENLISIEISSRTDISLKIKDAQIRELNSSIALISSDCHGLQYDLKYIKFAFHYLHRSQVLECQGKIDKAEQHNLKLSEEKTFLQEQFQLNQNTQQIWKNRNDKLQTEIHLKNNQMIYWKKKVKLYYS